LVMPIYKAIETRKFKLWLTKRDQNPQPTTPRA